MLYDKMRIYNVQIDRFFFLSNIKFCNGTFFFVCRLLFCQKNSRYIISIDRSIEKFSDFILIELSLKF